MSTRGTTWSDEDQETLAELWSDDQIQRKFGAMVHNGKIWDELAKKFNEITGEGRTGSQVKNKMKKLKAWYRNHAKQQGKSGAAGDQDHLWDIIDRVEGQKELTNPTYTGDTLGESSQSQDDEDSQVESPDGEDQQSTSSSNSMSPMDSQGAGVAPMYGDYEAQRHWMEVTRNLPIEQWYVNSTDNDLLYWGLDYPPLTAYHSWLCGLVAEHLNPDWVALNSSRGYESQQHKLFMRYTVLVVDVLIFIPAVLAFFSWTLSDRTEGEKLVCAAVALLYPGLILIDHGHFQYNNASLGFALWGIVALATGHDLLGSIGFVLALSYKQMELYHAMPFFCYLLGKCLFAKDENGFFKLIKIGITVIISFGLCWLPFLMDKDILLQVIHRLFPFDRGLFEDKVSNLWCSLEVLLKIRRLLSQQSLVQLSLATTIVGLLPSSVDLLLRPNIQKFKLALVNSSLVFFLFSYQVHEKSILIVALPVCLLLHQYSFTCMWFLLLSTFSMLPLLIKDGLVLPYLALCLLFYIAVCVSQTEWFTSKPNPAPHVGLQLMFWASILGATLLSIASVSVRPPVRYPDLFPVLVSVYSCGHFLLFLVYFHYLQFSTPWLSESKVPQKRVDHAVYSRKGKGKKKSHKVD